MQPSSAVAAGKKKRIDAAINGTGKIWRGNGSLKQGTFKLNAPVHDVIFLNTPKNCLTEPPLNRTCSPHQQ